MKPNLRPVLYLSDSAEANFLLRKRQYEFSDDDMSVGKVLVLNKILNQKAALLRSRKKDSKTIDAIKLCENVLGTINDVNDYSELMGKEGAVSKSFFAAYYQGLEWKGRYPRMKTDPLNVTLDTGYSVLFNFIESFVRIFGFDIYM